MKHAAIVELMLSHGALVDLRTSQTPRPIVVACQSGNIEVLKLLVEHGAFIDCHAVDDDHAPIHPAVISRNAELVEYLCRLGANVESRTKSTGYTPLELACLFQEPLILESLLEMGAKPFSSYDGFSWIRQPHYMAMLEHNDAVLEKFNALDPALFHQGNTASGTTVLHELFDSSFGGGPRHLSRTTASASATPGPAVDPGQVGKPPAPHGRREARRELEVHPALRRRGHLPARYHGRGRPRSQRPGTRRPLPRLLGRRRDRGRVAPEVPRRSRHGLGTSEPLWRHPPDQRRGRGAVPDVKTPQRGRRGRREAAAAGDPPTSVVRSMQAALDS